MVKELIFKMTHSRETSLGYGKAFGAFEEVKEGVVRTECCNNVERADRGEILINFGFQILR